MNMHNLHTAIEVLERQEDEGFAEAEGLVGTEVALAILATMLTRNFYFRGVYQTDVPLMVNGALSQKVSEVYKVFSQNPALFYMKRWYCFDNFSAFSIVWRNRWYATVEHAYQSAKFLYSGDLPDKEGGIAEAIRVATSAHEAKRMGNLEVFQESLREDWVPEVKLSLMKELLRLKYDQHEYVRRKLAQSKGMILIEDSSTDSFWGRGPDWKGERHLGRLWEKIRDEKC